MKKAIRIILALCLSLSLAAAAPSGKAHASNKQASGFVGVGTDISYTFDAATGTLTITGTGEIKEPAEDDHLTDTVTFAGDVDIIKVIFEEGITNIPDDMFTGCMSITSVSLPSTMKVIGNCAFFGCEGLKSIVIPEGVESLSETFCECTNLESVTLPVSLKELLRDVFSGCTNLKEINYSGTQEQWEKIKIELEIPHTEDEDETFDEEDEFFDDDDDDDDDETTKKDEFDPDFAEEEDEEDEDEDLIVSYEGENTLTIEEFFNGSVVKFSDGKKIDYKKTLVTRIKPDIELTKSIFEYNGKNQKPTVKVTADGKTLKEKTDYTVEFPKKAKNVGKYIVTVTLRGKYLGAAAAKYYIIPKKPELKEASSSVKKVLSLKWKKVKKNAAGYEIQISQKKNFSEKNSTTKKYTVKKAKKTKYSIKNLKSKKTYYVRIRTYKKAGGIKYYSEWSTVKKVKIK